MVWTALLLSRLQFAFTVSFHIIFPSFTIGLAAWIMVLEAFHQITGNPVYRRPFEFWLKIFGVTFGLGVVSGIVPAFEFGMNWSRLSEGRRRRRSARPACNRLAAVQTIKIEFTGTTATYATRS
jgi:cytochrome bd ubiquinol oxidase subunit I